MDPISPKGSRKGRKAKEDASSVAPEAVADSSEPAKSMKRTRSKSPKSKREIIDSGSTSTSRQAEGCDWETLPMEVCLRIVEGLSSDIPSLLSLGQVSTYWRAISTSEQAWREMFHRTFLKLEPHDEYFLQHGAPKPTLLKEVQTRTGTIPIGPSSFYHLFSVKWPMHQRWMRNQFTSSNIKTQVEDDRFSMMVPWRGFCVTAGSDGSIRLWHPKSFSSSSSTKEKEKNKLKPWRIIKSHEYHIWWMTIQGDLCFSVGSDGTLRVTDLSPLANDQNAELDAVVVTASTIPIWAIDVHRRSRKLVIGSQDGTVSLLSWKKGDWKSWKVIRTIKVRSGVWDVCILPDRRFAVCCSIDISIFNFDPTESEKAIDLETPPVANPNALVGINPRSTMTNVDAKLPPEGAIFENRPRGGLTRNLNLIEGVLIAACSTVGLEAWDVSTGERLWTLSTRGYDIFDVGITNNKLVCAGTDDRTGFTGILVFDAKTHQLILETGPDEPIGRVFSTCVTDESIYVCALGSLYHINFKPPNKPSKEDSSGCSIS